MNSQETVSAIPMEPTRRRFEMPHIYVILFFFTAIAAVLAHFVPAGPYDRVPGRLLRGPAT